MPFTLISRNNTTNERMSKFEMTSSIETEKERENYGEKTAQYTSTEEQYKIFNKYTGCLGKKENEKNIAIMTKHFLESQKAINPITIKTDKNLKPSHSKFQKPVI